MPGYISSTLRKFRDKSIARPQYAPYPWNTSIYGKNTQLATQKISAPKLNSADTNFVQSINGTFLYYAHAVDPTMIPYLNKKSTCKSSPTQETMQKFNQVMDYASMHSNATIRYHTSDLVLMADTYSAYLLLPTSHSCIAGH